MKTVFGDLEQCKTWYTALAIGALGLALVPFAYAVSLAAPARVELMGSFKLLNEVDPKNVLLLGPALV